MYKQKFNVFSILLISTILLTSNLVTGLLPSMVTTMNREVNVDADESPLIVMFGHSEAEITAQNQLLTNFPNSKVVEFSSVTEILTHRGSVVYVGHSTSEGISYMNSLISWNEMSRLISLSISDNHFVLGCNSKTISDLTAATGKNVFSFESDVDAIVGVNVISYHIANLLSMGKQFQINIFSKLFNRLIDITTNPSLSLPMRFGGTEEYSIGIIGGALAVTLFPLTTAAIAWNIATFTVGLLSIVSHVFTFIQVVLDILAGKPADTAAGVSSLVQIIFGIGAALIVLIQKKPWWEQPFYYMLYTGDTAKNALASVAVVFVCAFALAVLMWYLLTFINDVFDYDLVLG